MDEQKRRLFAPFKPPRISSQSSSSSQSSASSQPSGLGLKRQKTSSNTTTTSTTALATHSSSQSLSNKTYNILYRTKTLKKNKTWDGDGKLSYNASSNTAVIKDESEYQIAKITKNAWKLIQAGEVFAVGSLEFEVDGEISTIASSPVAPAPLKTINNNIPLKKSLNPARPFKSLVPQKSGTTENSSTDTGTNATVNNIKNSTTSTALPFKPLFQQSAKSKTSDLFTPLFDPQSPNAIAMPPPPSKCLSKGNGKFVEVVIDPSVSINLRDHQISGVKFLYECVMGYRNYEGHGAILADEMGMGKTLMTITLIWTLLRQNPFYHIDKSPAIRKVLICCPVTLIGNWNKEFKKWIGASKINVLCINGSKNGAKDKQDIINFAKTRVYQVLIIGYEKMVSCSKELSQVKTFDLIICDEGHRLKNSTNKVLKTLESFNIPKRIVLSGTPIQNDLIEFYNIINFINPGILGDLKAFTKDFVKPILQSRETNCFNDEVISKGESRSKKLINLTKMFILRRTKDDTISKFLPLRTDFLLFVPPNPLQIKLFKTIESTQKLSKLISSNNKNDSLPLITTYRKLCNSPSLVKNDGLFLEICGRNSDSPEDDAFRKGLAKKVKSGKINILIKLLKEFYLLGDKTVIISNFTSTLDVLEEVIKTLNLPFSRLDGSTPAKARDKIVKDFNNLEFEKQPVFLLSAKSGGMGLNLIGANRLIMFDNDWNPSVDLQAMARVHRDGQIKSVFIYRLLTAGCIDEKILQRQLIKTNLSDKFLDDGGSKTNENFFDYSDLRDLFTVQEGCLSNTHDLMDCDCPGDGYCAADNGEEEEVAVEDDDRVKEPSSDDKEDESPQRAKKQASWMSALDYQQLSQLDKDSDPMKKKQAIIKCLAQYRHINPISFFSNDDKELSEMSTVGDEVLDKLIRNQETNSLVSYIFTKVYSTS